MNRKLFFNVLLLLMLTFTQSTFAQQTTAIKLNTIRHADSIAHIELAYRHYIDGRVFFVNKTVTPAKLNYNRATDQILFKDNKNEVLALGSLESVEKIGIGNDVYLYSPAGFLKQLAAYPSVTLVKKSNLKFSGQARKGAYGGYSEVTGNRAITTMSDEYQTTNQIAVDQNLSYLLTETYYLLTSSKKLIKANEKAFLAAYSDSKKELQDYFATTKVDFNKEQDLRNLLQFAESLK